MKNYTCPYCNCSSLSRYGKVKNIQRYKCKHCKRTFRETSGTPLFGLHKVEKVAKYLKALRMGMSIRKTAHYVGISNNTSFTWRHKFLSSLTPKESIDCNNSDTNMQIITLEYSDKGRKKAPEKNRTPTKTLITQRSGQVCLYKLAPENPVKNASEILKQSTIQNCVVGKPHKLLSSAINHSGSQAVYTPKIIKKSKHELCKQLQSINEWMAKFKGVASKYLQQYWNWYLTINNMTDINKRDEIFIQQCCSTRNLHHFYKLKEI